MSDKVKLNTTASKIDVKGDAWVLNFPRFGAEGTHYHTYGQLTPYFKGLTEGKLLGTKCVNPQCPICKGNGELWIPPRTHCPDCHSTMEWEEIVNPQGYIYTYTFVERGGTGLEIETPYYQVDVFVEGVCTIIKGYLLDRTPIKIGDKVKAGFLAGDQATNTCLDIYWELI